MEETLTKCPIEPSYLKTAVTMEDRHQTDAFWVNRAFGWHNFEYVNGANFFNFSSFSSDFKAGRR